MKKILVCTDGSAPYANVCYDYGAWLAEKSGAALEVLYVTDLRQFEMPMVADLNGGFVGPQPYQTVLEKLQELERDRAKVILEQARLRLAQHTLPGGVTFTHRTGFLADTLRDFEPAVNLLVLGKRGKNANFATEHLGSTMERVVRSSLKPCLVTSRVFKPVQKVLLAYDGGKSCEKALQMLAASTVLRGLELHVVTVTDRSHEAAAAKHLQTAEAALRAAGYAPVCQMLQGVPEQEIASYVETREMSLLIMGAYGHSRIRQLVIGSTTAEMIRRCKIPVLLFR